MFRLPAKLWVFPLCLALGACATVEDTPHFPSYQAQPALIAGAQNIKVEVEVNDARDYNRERISTKINGFGMEMAAIRSADDIAQVVKQATEACLTARGYNLAGDGDHLNIGIKTFYATYKSGIVSMSVLGVVDLDVTLADQNGHQLYQTSEHGTSSDSALLANGSNAARALNEAMGNAFDQLFGDRGFMLALGPSATSQPIAATPSTPAGSTVPPEAVNQ